MSGDNDVWQAVAAERRSLIGLLEGLDERQWDHPSLCAEWHVRDVVAHVVLVSSARLGWILANVLRARGDLERAIRDTAIRHAARRSSAELIAELRAGVDARIAPLNSTPVDRLMDLLVHAQDIAIPLGLVHDMPAAAAAMAMERVWTRDAPFRARARMGAVRLVATDAEWSGGDGPVIEAPIARLLLAATGRIDITSPRR